MSKYAYIYLLIYLFILVILMMGAATLETCRVALL